MKTYKVMFRLRPRGLILATLVRVVGTSARAENVVRSVYGQSTIIEHVTAMNWPLMPSGLAVLTESGRLEKEVQS